MRRGSGSLEDAIAFVVESGNCSGCGACALVSPRVTMKLSREGFLRPQLRDDLQHTEDGQLTRRFMRVCPGVRVAAPRHESADARWHPVFGRYEGVWEAWANDFEIRYRGSSGGVLTALARWISEQSPGSVTLGAAGDRQFPTHSAPTTIRTRDEALRAAGSRYAPVAVLPALADGDKNVAAATVKPCEASALRAFSDVSGIAPPVILSFFCAGTPSQLTTDRLIGQLGLDPNKVREVRYRGNGWPGGFAATDGSTTVRETYEVSWMQHFGRAIQARCKICVDGTGEHADIAVGDYWTADERGIPIFDEKDGRSVVIARTNRGLELVRAAIDAGAIQGEVMNLDRVTTVQPHQRVRRRTLIGRLTGRMLRGGIVPRYTGYHLLRGVVRDPLRNAKALLGSVTRGTPRERWER